MKFPVLALATAGLLSFGSAQAMIVNISAASAEPTVITLDAGTYAWNWIGTAQGGAFDAWSTDGANWRGAFTLTLSYFGMSQSVVFDTYKPAGGFAADGSYQYAAYSSPTEALAAFQSNMFSVISPVDNAERGPFSSADLRLEIPPFPMQLSFSLPADVTGDRTGGVSLSITAVPEPGTYTLMLAGIAVIGALVLRRLRRDE